MSGLDGPRQTIVTNSQSQVIDNPTDQQTREQIIADYEKQQADKIEQERLDREARQQQLIQEREQRRVQRNHNFDTGVTRFYPQYEQHSSGVRGYHWGSNFKGNDGNYYALYNANRGDNKRYYSISEQKWYENTYFVGRVTCHNQNCQQEFDFVDSGFPNTCPHCGIVRNNKWS